MNAVSDKKRQGIFKKFVKWVLLLLVPTLAGILIYSGYLSARIDQRFSARRWSIPSKVFSDTTLLYPGQRIQRQPFYEKLLNLGYRSVAHPPVRRGEMLVSATGVTVFLYDLNTPWHTRQGFVATITTSENRIESIARTADGQFIPILELEPEEVMLFFGPKRERRQLVSIREVPQHLIHAVLAAEDSRFYRHHGVDPRGLLRAMLANLRHGAIRQGGSTLTQQLAKNYFLTPAKTLTRKLKEVLLSVLIELKYEKDDILEIYLNEIYLGQKGSVSINGVGEASFFYFGKPVRELSRAEAATIAGLIKAPNYYSPYVDKEHCRERRNDILEAMRKKGWLSEEELQAALKIPVNPVGYTVPGKKAPYFVDYLAEQLTNLYRPEDLSSLGLSIYTTLDTQVQTAAERALVDGLARLEKSNPALKRDQPGRELQGAIIVMQPKTGYILAMVGGRNYSVSQFNRVTQAKRQPGSAFKPLVYLAALDKFPPTYKLSNEPKTYFFDGKSWEPQNFQPTAPSTVNMREALKMSYNLATVDLAMQTGLDRIVETATQFNLTTPVKPYPSLALGSFEVIPLELARAYCVFAADGMQPNPLALKDVVDEKGQILEQKHLKVKRLISPARAFIINDMLQSVVTAGTARSLAQFGVTGPVAGKTGTTNDFRDAWFVGYTPDILALVWVGFDNGDPIGATASMAALPIWAELIDSIPQYLSVKGFKVPDGIEKKTVCAETGLLAVENGCPEPFTEYFLSDRVPTEFCTLHRKPGLKERLIKGIKKLFNGK
jgi:penicillin-binding protein 1B